MANKILNNSWLEMAREKYVSWQWPNLRRVLIHSNESKPFWRCQSVSRSIHLKTLKSSLLMWHLKIIPMCCVMHLLHIFHFPKPNKTGKISLHKKAEWHSNCRLSCFLMFPDKISPWSFSSDLKIFILAWLLFLQYRLIFQ